MTNLNEKFFTEVMRWEPWYSLTCKHPDDQPCHWQHNGEILTELPNPAGCWEDFHKWVVPELISKAHKMNAYDKQAYLRKVAIHLGAFYIREETPERALQWAMEELNK